MVHYDDYDDLWYCGGCSGRSFVNRHSLEQHLNSSPYHNYCSKCDRDFSSFHGLQQHLRNSSSHSWCDNCEQSFDEYDEFLDHNRERHHLCESCEQVFWNEGALDRHRDSNHFYCKPCDKFFQNENNLRMHLNSSIHRPRDIPCPMRGCNKKFISYAHLVLHWESGTCASGITRQMIDQYITRHDLGKYITNPQRMITGGDNYRRYGATERAWNGEAYECYLCHKMFRTLNVLNQHLESPAHSGGGKIYQCPQTRCNVQFKTLSGLIQHIENGKCGAYQNRFVQGALENLSRGIRSITF